MSQKSARKFGWRVQTDVPGNTDTEYSIYWISGYSLCLIMCLTGRWVTVLKKYVLLVGGDGLLGMGLRPDLKS
jgi:hypothetical protein